MKTYYYLALLLLTPYLYSQININDEFNFNNSRKAMDREKYLLPVNENGTANYQNDLLSMNSENRLVYSINEANDGLIYTIDNEADFTNYTYNIIYYMPPSSSYNRIHRFGNLDSGLYRQGTYYNFYSTGISQTPSALPATENYYSHIGITKDGATNTVKVYINGELYNTYTSTSQAFNVQSDKRFIFFKDDLSEDNIAKVAYINVANYVQSAETIKNLYLGIFNLIINQTYFFNQNLSSTTNENNLSINNANYETLFDEDCQLNRNTLVLTDQNALTQTIEYNNFSSYTYLFKYRTTDQNKSFNILDFTHDQVDRSIKVINRKLYFAGQESAIILDTHATNSFADLAITRNSETKMINIYFKNQHVGEYLDAADLFVKQNHPVKLLTPLASDLTHNLGFLHFENNEINLTNIIAITQDACSKTIENAYQFNANLNNTTTTNSLTVSSANNEHYYNYFSAINDINCISPRTTYSLNPNSKLVYKDAIGMYYYNYSVVLNYRSDNTQKIKLFGIDNSSNGIYQQGNSIIYQSGSSIQTLTNQTINNSLFNTLLITRSGANKTIQIYSNDQLIGSFTDNDNLFEIKPAGEIIFFNNSITSANNIFLNDIQIFNKILAYEDYTTIINSYCTQLITNKYIFDRNLTNQNDENPLVFNSSSTNYLENFYSDKNDGCGERKQFFKLNENENLTFNGTNHLNENYTIHLNFKFDDYTISNRLITFENDFNMYLENKILKFSNSSQNFDLTTHLTLPYNLLTITKEDNLIKLYINGVYIGSVNSNSFSFPTQQPLTLFGNSKVSIGYFETMNKIMNDTEIINYKKDFCFRKIDRIFPLFMNLTDSSGENTLAVTSYNNEHINNKFIQDNVVNCRVSRTIYFVERFAGLIFNDGLGELYDDYTISLYFRLNPYLGSWARLIDFSNGLKDDGIYQRNSGLEFWPNGFIGNNLLTNSDQEYTLLTLTRDKNTNIITVYINGVKASTYNDSPGLYKVPANGNIIFIKDDIEIPYEQSPINLAMIRVSNTILSDEEIAEGYTNICTDIACTQPANKIGEIKPSLVGISTRPNNERNWPMSVNGGNLVLESDKKGLVLPRISNANSAINTNESIEGMIIYDNDNKCIKMYNGNEWKCITATCVQ